MREDIIKSKLKQIEENLTLVKNNLPESLEEFQVLGLIKDGIYKRVESSIQEILSICSIINSDLNLGIPSNRDDIINALVKDNIITEDIGKKVKSMKGFRNFLIYNYGRLQDDIAYENIKEGFSDFDDFKSAILSFLMSSKE